MFTFFCFARGPGFNPHPRHFFLSLFSRFSLIPSQSASLYIFASFEVNLIAENNFPHVVVFLFQKSSTVQYILTPSIFDSIDMPFIVFHKLTRWHD